LKGEEEKIMAAKKANARLLKSTRDRHDALRPYYGVKEADYAEGGGFGRHRDTVAGQSQEGSRNPSGHTVKPTVTTPRKKGDSPGG
jgi:hypothetical protein